MLASTELEVGHFDSLLRRDYGAVEVKRLHQSKFSPSKIQSQSMDKLLNTAEE